MGELPTDALYDLTRPVQMAVSPGGKRVAFQALEYEPRDDAHRRSVFTVPADGSRDPYRLTRVSDAATMKWSPDCSRLGVVMTRKADVELQVGRVHTDHSQDVRSEGMLAANDNDTAHSGGVGKDSRPQLWVYDLERGGDARQVTNLVEGVRDFDWDSSGKRVVVSARDPTEDEKEYLQQRRQDGPIEIERLQHKVNGVGWLDSVTTYLFVVNVDSRETCRLDDAHGGGILESAQGLQPAWHPEDDRIAFVSNHGDKSDDTYVQDVHVVDATSDEVEQLTAGEYMAGGPTWSPDGSKMAFTARDPVNWHVPTDVCIADITTGEYRSITDGLDRHLAGTEQTVWLDTDQLLTVIGDGGWSRFVRLSAGGGHERVFGWQSREASVTQFDAEGDTLALTRTHPRDGIDIYAMTPADLDDTEDNGAPFHRLTHNNPGIIADYDHPETGRVILEGAAGDEIEGIAFHPPEFDPGDPDGDRPLLLSIHGGPRQFDFPHFNFDISYWTTRGYIVFKVNYHGSTSYGQEFCEQLNGAWNDIEVLDMLAATDELVERKWVDPDRLFVSGFSHGGVITAYLLAASDRFTAAVAEHGLHDLRSAFGTDDSHEWWTNEFGLPWENPQVYDDASSITNVDNIDTPLLVTAGEKDWRCPPTQAEQLYVSLKKRGIESKLVVYPNEHHVHYYIHNPGHATHRLETILEWFERFDTTIGGTEEDSEDIC